MFSDGFADAGAEGAARQARLAARAKELGVRLLGPNSMGVIDIPGRLALTVNAVLEMDALPAGGTSIVSQSGTMLGTVLSRGAARGLGFAKLVSVGNEADLGVGELVELLADDADTRVILLFLETVRDAERLAAAARRAHAAGKPVVAYKLGRSALGERLARSHTGALAGSDAALDAYFRDCGILRVDMLETLIEIAPLVRGRAPAAAQARAPALRWSPPPAAARRAWSTGSASRASRPSRRAATRRSSTSPWPAPRPSTPRRSPRCSPRPSATRCSRWSAPRPCSTRSTRSSRSSRRRARPSRSPPSSPRTPSSRSRCSRAPRCPRSAPRKPARMRSGLISNGESHAGLTLKVSI